MTASHPLPPLVYPPDLNLLPFQVEATSKTLSFLINNPAGACYNACEMGLGKTLQAIVCANSLLASRILVVCPAVMRLVWEREIAKWAVAAPTIYTVLSGKDADELTKHPVASNTLRGGYPRYVVTSYDLASSRPFLTWLENQPWDLLILDEAHFLKTSTAKRTRAILGDVWKAASHKIALSGTPFTTRVVDGYTLFRRMLPKQWPDFDSFADEFSYKQIKRIGGRVITDYFGVKNPEKLRKLIRSNFYVRYTKDEVLKDLPAKQFTQISLPIKYAVMPKGTTEKDQLEIEAEMIRRAIENDKPIPVPKCLAEHRRLQGEKKVGPIIDFVKDLLEQDVPVVLFAWHRLVIEEICKGLSAYRAAVITGETPARQRMVEVDRFMCGETNLFVGNISAAGVGITLTRSSTVVLAELDWSPASVAQAVDRCHRIGQENSVNVYFFTVANSLDEAITNTVMSRSRTFKSVLDGK